MEFIALWGIFRVDPFHVVDATAASVGRTPYDRLNGRRWKEFFSQLVTCSSRHATISRRSPPRPQ